MNGALFAMMVLAETIPHEWSYVTASYVLVVGVLVAYVAWIMIRAKSVMKHLPPKDRRWM